MDASKPNIRQVFGSRLNHTARQWRQAVNNQLAPFGLTDATWLPLLHVARGKIPMRQKDLAESVGIESSTLVRLVDALDKAGLIERRIEADRRVRNIRLTTRGRVLVEQMEAVTTAVRNRVLAGISDEELALTLSVIERIDAALARVRAPETADTA